jgi:hypothetical protein
MEEEEEEEVDSEEEIEEEEEEETEEHPEEEVDLEEEEDPEELKFSSFLISMKVFLLLRDLALTYSVLRTSYQDNQSIMKRESVSKTKTVRRLNIEFGIPTDPKLQLLS